MRSVGSELVAVTVVLAIPLGIVAAFPFAALGFRAAPVAPQPVRTAFVTLSPAAERKALRAVRASWSEKVGSARRLRADLFCVELPEDPLTSVLSLRDRSRPPSLPEIPCGRTAFLPSQKAPPPAPIPGGTAAVPLTFPREELLKLN